MREPAVDRTERVVRKAQRDAVRSEWSKASAESLVPGGAHDWLSALLITLDADGRTGTLPIRRSARGFAYCIRGQVRLTLGDERYELSTSDSVVLDHGTCCWENRGRSRAEVLVVWFRA